MVLSLFLFARPADQVASFLYNPDEPPPPPIPDESWEGRAAALRKRPVVARTRG